MGDGLSDNQPNQISELMLPPWMRVNLEEEISSAEYYGGPSTIPRLVEYVGDQYHQKNPHTRRTILLNQIRTSRNDPLVFYRFYQFSCPCMGNVWFSPLHRAKDGCYCRDCHKFVKPFGHIDGLTPYMGYELCYAKFQCHHCGRSWSCQRSKSNFPDNCFCCSTIVYPYYQVTHSVLRRKIMRHASNRPPPGDGGGGFLDMFQTQSDASFEGDDCTNFSYESVYSYGHESESKMTHGLRDNGKMDDGRRMSPSNTLIPQQAILNNPQGRARPKLKDTKKVKHSVSDTAVILGNRSGQDDFEEGETND